MAQFKRKPPPRVVSWTYCFLLDFVAPPVVQALERTGHIDGFLRRLSDRRVRRNTRRNPFRRYIPGKQDVFVMTYAKSGTNWTLQIVWQLIQHCRKDFEHIHSVVPWPDVTLASWTMYNYAIPLKQSTEWQTAPERKRIIKTHLNWEHVPYSKEARYIAVIRDPKDVFVSLYFFIRDLLLGAATPSKEAMFRAFAAGKGMANGSWAVNAAGFWAQRHRPNVLILFYASMKRDLEGTVRRIATFLNIDVSDAIIHEVCRRSSFEYMQSIDVRFRPYNGAPWRKGGRMMRKGQQGGASELLSPDEQAELDASLQAELARLGSDLPYDQVCGR